MTNSKESQQQSRRDKLKDFVAKRQILEEEKRKKSKPVFRAGGVVQHPYSAFGGPKPKPSSSLHNNSKLSVSTSNLSFSSNRSFQRPKPRFTRSSSLTNIQSSKDISLDDGKILNVIEEDRDLKSAKDDQKEDEFSSVKQNFESELELKVYKENNSLNRVENLGENKSRKVYDQTLVGRMIQLFENFVPGTETKLEAPNDLNEEEINDNCNEMEKITLTSTDLDINSPTTNEDENILKVKPFRDLLVTETERLTSMCGTWEAKIPNIPEGQEYEDIRGEVRSVVGQGRLVMAERFHQFSGLVDNCQLKRGEKETTVEDLQGFWEMIYIQVEDVDKKFAGLVAIEENSWRPIEVRQIKKPKLKNPGKSTTYSGKSKQSSSGLKALIAARRKAKSDQVPEVTVREVEPSPSKTESSESKEPADNWREPTDKTFDGGFFTVKSPMCEKKTPRSCRNSSNKIRKVALNNSAKKVNSLLLSPFISAFAKMSLAPDNTSSPVKAPKPMVLFKADECESDEKETLEGNMKIDDPYFMPLTITTPASC